MVLELASVISPSLWYESCWSLEPPLTSSGEFHIFKLSFFDTLHGYMFGHLLNVVIPALPIQVENPTINITFTTSIQVMGDYHDASLETCFVPFGKWANLSTVDFYYSFTNTTWLHGVRVLVMLLLAQGNTQTKANESSKGLVGALPLDEPWAIHTCQCKYDIVINFATYFSDVQRVSNDVGHLFMTHMFIVVAQALAKPCMKSHAISRDTQGKYVLSSKPQSNDLFDYLPQTHTKMHIHKISQPLM